MAFKKLTPEQQTEQNQKKAEERLGNAILKAEGGRGYGSAPERAASPTRRLVADPELDGQMRRWDGSTWTAEVKSPPIARLTEGAPDDADAADVP